jgi:hypothetical protein
MHSTSEKWSSRKLFLMRDAPFSPAPYFHQFEKSFPLGSLLIMGSLLITPM